MWPWRKKKSPPSDDEAVALRSKLERCLQEHPALRAWAEQFAGEITGVGKGTRKTHGWEFPTEGAGESLKIIAWDPDHDTYPIREMAHLSKVMKREGIALNPTLHLNLSDETAQQFGLMLMGHSNAHWRPLNRNDFALDQHGQAFLALLAKLQSITSTQFGDSAWGHSHDLQEWLNDVSEEAFTNLRETHPNRVAEIENVHSLLRERRQPSGVFVPFNLTPGSFAPRQFGLSESGEIFVHEFWSLWYAPFEDTLAQMAMELGDEIFDPLLVAYLNLHGPRERQRVHLNFGFFRTLAALWNAGWTGKPEDLDALLRIAEQHL